MHLTRSSRCEPSLLRQTKCWSWPRGKTICRCVTSNAAAFYCYGATKELQLRPSLLHLRPPPSRWTLWSKVATERAWKQRGDRRFPSACWLHLYTNGLFHASDVWTERFVSVFLARRSDITDGFLSDISKDWFPFSLACDPLQLLTAQFFLHWSHKHSGRVSGILSDFGFNTSELSENSLLTFFIHVGSIS